MTGANRTLRDTIMREAADDSNGIADLVELLTKPLDLVADPFMGDSTGIVKIGRTLFHPVTDACLHLDRRFVGADPDGLFPGRFSAMADPDYLPAMVGDLRAGEPGQRIFHLGRGCPRRSAQVVNVIAEPSTYPGWLGSDKKHRTRQHADRIIRLVELYLDEKPMFTGSGACPPGFVPISREDTALLDSVLELASGPLDEADLPDLLRADDEAPNGPAGEAAASEVASP